MTKRLDRHRITPPNDTVKQPRYDADVNQGHASTLDSKTMQSITPVMSPLVSSLQTASRSRSIPASKSFSFRREAMTRLRLHLSIGKGNRQEPITTRLMVDYGLVVKVTHARCEPDGTVKQLDLELIGTPAQLQLGLAYLNSLADSRIQGKANVDGDSWHY